MIIDKKHLEDINVYTDVFYNIFSGNATYEKSDLSKGMKAYIVPELQGRNTDFLHLDIYSLIGAMNSDYIIDGLDDEKLKYAVETGEFYIKSHNPFSKKTLDLFESDKIKKEDILYKTGELVIKEEPYKLVLRRSHGRSPWEEVLIADSGLNIEEGYGSNKSFLKLIRNCLLAHNSYEFKDETIYIDYRGKKINFSLSWLSGLSRFLNDFQSCEMKSDGKYNSLYIPIMPDINQQDDFMKARRSGDAATKLSKFIKSGFTIILTVHKNLNMVQSELSSWVTNDAFYGFPTVEKKLEYIETSLKRMGLTEQDFTVKAKPIAEVYSDFSLENIALRILQIDGYFEKEDAERGTILNNMFMFNQTEKMLGLPSSVGTGIIYTMQEVAEQIIPEAQYHLQKSHIYGELSKSEAVSANSEKIIIEKLEALRGRKFTREERRDILKRPNIKSQIAELSARERQFNIRTEARRLIKEEIKENRFYVADNLPSWKHTDAKNCVVLLAAYNSLVNTNFVDDLCSMGLETSNLFSTEDIKLIDNLDVSGFKIAYAKNFCENDFNSVLNPYGKHWKDAEKAPSPFDTKRKMLNIIRTAITHGTVGFLYGNKEQDNEIVFFKNSERENNETVTNIIKCNVNVAYKFFKDPTFFRQTKTRELIETKDFKEKIYN